MVHALTAISSASGWNADSSSKATSFLNKITQFPFIATFIVTSKIMAYTAQLTVGLQKKALDIVKAYQHIKVVMDTVDLVRQSADEYHEKWFIEAVDMAKSVIVQPAMPRICSRQTQRDNAPSSIPSEYIKRNVTIPFLDELSGQMKQRFSSVQQTAVSGLSLIPKVFFSDQSTARSSIRKLAEEYSMDMPSTFIDGSSLDAELDTWSHLMLSLPNPPDKIQEVLKLTNSDHFPQLHLLLRLVSTFPVTSCETERSVSKLRRLKNYLRSSMGQERMSGLALIHTHYNMDINMEEVLSRFIAMHPRRIIMGDILKD